MQYFVCSNLSCVEANRGIHGHLPNQSNDSYVNVCENWQALSVGLFQVNCSSWSSSRHGGGEEWFVALLCSGALDFSPLPV